MEGRWPKAKCKGGHQNPSFSSTLLDAIYRSIDETDGCAGAPAPEPRDHRCATSIPPKRPLPPLRPTADRRAAAGGNQRNAGRCRPLAPISTSSSSDKSSYGGFSSSSEPDSVAARLRPIRTGAAPLRSIPPPPPFGRREEEETKKKKKTGSIRGKLRDMRGSLSAAPASPGSRLAGFLGSLLSAVSGTPRRPPPASPACTASGGCEDSACSTASSHSRSCLTKKPSTRERSADGGKRTVRFYPVSVIVDGDLRPCGQKSVYEADPPAPRRASGAAAMEARRRVEELLRGMTEEYEEEMSDSSSDLFELENLTTIGRRMDELPVYETTRLNTNPSFSQSHRFLRI